MCGIAGIIDTREAGSVSSALIRSMCRTIVHRGPDDEGIYAAGGVGLGMRRLSIIDLSGGKQPIHNEDQSVWVVFNGEIYNFPELREQLENGGHRFYTDTDTEVIVHLYEQYGVDCVQKLRGMFAFACYDYNTRRLLLARDRLGKKPLHYAFSNGRFLFGSEIKELLEVAPELLELAPASAMQYFQFGYIPDPNTAFKNIHKLPPGHLAILENGNLTVRQYWDLPPFVAEEQSEQEILERLEAELAEAVRIRLISDVPLGAFLSGGVDSSIVVALMARASSRPVKTFSVAFGNQDFNESKYARTVAERFATEHHEMAVNPDILETVHMLTSMLEEPFADSSIVPTYHVSRLTRQHVTVALAGDGGDELFGGYDRYAVALRRAVFDELPGWMGRFYRSAVYPRLPHALAGRKFAYNITLPSRDRYIDGVSFLSLRNGDQPVFSQDFLESARRWPDCREQFQDYFDHAPAQDLLSKLQYLDVKTYLAGDILTKVDRMSMATSLEVRAPLLDHVVAEYASRVPAHLKSDGKTQKYILKRLAERLGIPGTVLHRQKQGFAIPLVHWLRNELKEVTMTLLTEPRTLDRGFFNPSGVRLLLDEHFKSKRDHSATIWLMLVFELWHRNFLETRPVRNGQAESHEEHALTSPKAQ